MQSQMPAEEARTRDNRVSGYGKPLAQAIPAAQPRHQRGDEQERRDVGAERVNRADPAFGA